MSSVPKTFLTPEQYFEIERKAEFKSEYFRGEMFAMSGASRPHNLIAGHAFIQLSGQLEKGPCEAYHADMRVQVSDTGLYTYPDVVVACGPKFLAGGTHTLLNPKLIVEVLSPSTEAYDLGLKFDMYQAIESLRQYVVVSSERVHVEVRTRQENGLWMLSMTSRLEDTVELESIGCRLSVAGLYERIDFGEQGPSARPPLREGPD